MLEIPRKAAWNACHRRLGGRPGGLGARRGLGAWVGGPGAWGPGGLGGAPGGLGGMGGAPGAPPIAPTPSPAEGIAPLEPRHADDTPSNSS